MASRTFASGKPCVCLGCCHCGGKQFRTVRWVLWLPLDARKQWETSYPGFNLDPAVGCARGCRDWHARQGARTRRTPVRKDEQRRMAGRARCHRVHSALTGKVKALERKIVFKHADLHVRTSGQLPDLGSMQTRKVVEVSDSNLGRSAPSPRIPAVAFAVHAAHQAMLGQQALVKTAGVLRAPV